MKKFIEKNISDPIKHYSRHNVFSLNKIATLRALDQLSASELIALEKDEMMEMVKHAASHSSFYRDRLRNNNLTGAFNDVYHSLPVISKNDIRSQEKSISIRPVQFMKKGLTSGSTGAALAVYRSPMAILNEYAYVWYYRMSHGLKKGDPAVSMRKSLKRGQLFYFNKTENILYLSPTALSDSNAGKLIDLLSAFRPKALLAYPSFACNLVHLLCKKNYKIQIPLIFTSSETVHIHQRLKVEEYFAGRIFDWYGNVERTIAIGECDFGHYHEMPLYSYNEYRENGIVTTSLINKAYPLIKYFVEDKIVKLNQTCKCGKGHVIKSIDGRVTDSLRLKDDIYISGPTIGSALMNVPNITHAQIVQKSPHELDINIVPSQLFSTENERLLLNNLRSKLPEGIIMRLNKIEEEQIIILNSGKFKFIVSEFNKP